jgi:CubicO group peptidase (beta-lactamase class C family)
MKLIYQTGIIIVLSLFISCSTGKYMGRYITWAKSDIKDYKKFPGCPVNNIPPGISFPKKENAVSIQEVKYDGSLPPKNLEQLLKDNGTTAFIVIRNDSVLYEKYMNGYERSSVNTSFSMAKSVTSLLTGIAIDDGFIENTNVPITKYLPELKTKDPRFERITIEHLLDMKSGLKFTDNGLPWGDRAKAYYLPHLRKRLMKLKIESEPGKKFEYNTYHPQLLGLILERATGKNPALYFQEKIWKPLGMEYGATWSMNSHADSLIMMQSGINCRAVDFAKIGRLILEKGKYRGKQIVSEEWIKKSIAYDEQNRFKNDKVIHYESAWWITEPAPNYRYCVYADGHLGQFLFTFPNEKIIILRMGKRMGKETGSVNNWLIIANHIITQLNRK